MFEPPSPRPAKRSPERLSKPAAVGGSSGTRQVPGIPLYLRASLEDAGREPHRVESCLDDEVQCAPEEGTGTLVSDRRGMVADDGQLAGIALNSAAQQLPHLDVIQPAFGHHDLSGVRVQVGGIAAQCSEALGARGYTRGERIAFKSSPGVGLVAHEAAHVVQQRAPGAAEAIGTGRDAFEHQANEVATRVSQGLSVASMFGGGGASTPNSGSSHSGAVQFDKEDPEPSCEMSVDTVAAAQANDVSGVVKALRCFGGDVPGLTAERDRFDGATGQKLERWLLAHRSAGTLNPFLIGAALGPASISAAEATRRVFGSKPSKESASAEEGLRIIWKAIPLMERVLIYDEGFREIEQAQLDVIRNASPNDRLQLYCLELKNDPELKQFYEHLSPQEEYDARLLIAPNNGYDATLHLIDRGPGAGPIATAMLNLSPQDRSRAWGARYMELYHQLSTSEFRLLSDMAVGTEANALKARLILATEGIDDVEGIDSVVQRTRTVMVQYRYLKALMEDPDATEEERNGAQARLAELGDLAGLVALPEQGKPGEKGFMGTLLDADEAKFGNRALTVGADPFRVAKQRILHSAGWGGVDAEAVKSAFADLLAPVSLTPGDKTTPENAATRQQDANRQLRQKLLNDPEVRAILERLRLEPHSGGDLSLIEALATGDRFSELEHFFTTALQAGDDAQLFRITQEIGNNAAWRQRFKKWACEFGSTPSRVSGERREIVDALLDDKKPTDPDNIPVQKLLEYTGDVSTLKIVLSQISEKRRNKIRLGYWLRMEGKSPSNSTEADALLEYLELERQVQSSQTSAPLAVSRVAQQAGLGEAVASEQGVQDVLDALLGAGPTSAEAQDPADRFRAAGIMHHQIEQRLKANLGLSAPFTETDETMDAAAREFGAIWESVRQRGKLTEDEYKALKAAFEQFIVRLQEFRGANAFVRKIAATAAAVAASVVIIAVSGGTATPAVLAGAAAASAGIGLLTSEAFGGDYYDAVSKEGLGDAATFAVDGALNVLGGSLAARGVELLGMSGASLSRGAAQIAASAAEEAAASFGRRVAVGALEAAIDGAVGGAAGEGLNATFDEKTWRQGVAQGMGRVLKSTAWGGLIGGLSGGLTGGAIPLVGRGLRNLSQAIASLRTLHALPNADFENALKQAMRSSRVPAKVPEIHVLDPEEFKRAFNNPRSEAVTLLDDDVAVIYVRADANPRYSMAHEVSHLEQLADPLWRADLLLLTEPQLRGWEGLSAADRLSLFRIQVDVEIDALQRLLARLERTEGDVVEQIRDAHRQLAVLRSDRTAAEAITSQQLVEMNAGVLSIPGYLKNEPRLFYEGTKELHGAVPEANARTRRTARLVTDGSKLRDGEAAYHIGSTWHERTPYLSAVDGKVTAIRSAPNEGWTVEVTPSSGGDVRYYEIPKGGQLDVRKRAKVTPGQPLGSKTREYRLIEIRKGDVPVGQRQEILKLSGDGWVQRGSEVSARGLHTEATGRQLIRQQLADKVNIAKKAGEELRYYEIDPRNGSGGFDGVFVTVEGAGKDTRVSVRIIEVKDYPGRYVPKAEFTAITDNLEENLLVVKQRLLDLAKLLARERNADAGTRLTQLVENTDFEIELLLGEGTRMGAEAGGSSSVLAELRKEVSSGGKRLRLRERPPSTVPDDLVQVVPKNQHEIDKDDWRDAPWNDFEY